ncbi:MAG: hypothetical protein HY906_06370 [Deltaproteobacteria bacterium]|nr:hypothetical protein [Deltaproteobacteria bacterium]
MCHQLEPSCNAGVSRDSAPVLTNAFSALETDEPGTGGRASSKDDWRELEQTAVRIARLTAIEGNGALTGPDKLHLNSNALVA